ncbi:MAG: type III-D CRISPR-associated protein Csx19 [Promethearchaeota archaeon]
MQQNIYKIKKIYIEKNRGTLKKDNIENFVFDEFKNAYIVYWLYNEVLFGKLVNSSIIFYKEIKNLYNYLIEARIFNENAELHIWKSNGIYKYRYIVDKIVDKYNIEAIDAEQAMYGNKMENLNNGFYKIIEKKGIQYIIPKNFLKNKELSNENRLFLFTRNYINYNPIGQAGFMDARFLKIELQEVKL